MSSANIVDLKARRASPEAGELAQKLLASMRDLSANGLKAALQQAFTEVDDTLFEMSEKANGGALQQQYFDDLRSLRRTRDGASDRFDAALRGAFSLYLHGRNMQKRRRGSIPAPTNSAWSTIANLNSASPSPASPRAATTVSVVHALNSPAACNTCCSGLNPTASFHCPAASWRMPFVQQSRHCRSGWNHG
ncbi:MAG: DUF1631 family protein [Rhodanobacteraceae bacterium]|nr:DUF1631 family protein [Rhodanobacteraceae bacterium]